MEPHAYFNLAKGGLLLFWGLWLALAAAGHFLDVRTNRHLLGEVMRMTQLKEDPLLGKGLIGRAWTAPGAPAALLVLIALYQYFVVALLLRAAWLWLGGGDPVAATVAADQALLAFGAIWCFFLIGGLWFGYWIKMQMLQQVHMNMALLTLGSLILIHLRF